MGGRQAPIGFLGFGEAGFHLARGLRRAGAPPLIAFDINSTENTLGERIRARSAETGTCLVETPHALADGADVIVSVVTAASAVVAAQSVAAGLCADQFYVDLNSVSPATKHQISDVIGTGAGQFVEGAIMAPVPPTEHRVPIVLNGPSASSALAVLSRYQMRLEAMDRAIGAAAAVKMCRSIVIKGMEALLLECAVAADEYDAADRVFESLSETYPGMDWRKTAEYMIGRVLQHGERRAREMEEVAETIRAAGIEPLMAEATARRQDWEATLRRKGRLTGHRPENTAAFLKLLVDQRGALGAAPR
jgi:3-hydroxyisobutyrate dehydrogenase-like beta-hydroxyacid dehydrogenase